MVTVTSFASLEILAGVAFVVPLALDLLHIRLLPVVVFEILAGILIGPYGLGWVHADAGVQIFSLIGLSFLLFLAGIEIDLRHFRGSLMGIVAVAFVVSLALALLLSLGLGALNIIVDPLLVAITLVASSLGIVLPALKAAGQAESTFEQLVIAATSLAEFGAIILLTIFFSSVQSGQLGRVFVLVLLAILAVAVVRVVLRAEQSKRLTQLLVHLQDSTAQVRIRGSWALLAAFVVLAVNGLGLSAILGAFIAGIVLRLIDPDESTRHPEFRRELNAVGYGVFVPIFFLTTGIQFDLPALFSSPSALALVPILFVCLFIVRGVPVVLYRHFLTRRETVAAAFFQATSLTFILAATQIGVALHVMRTSTSAAFIAAALLSVIVCPLGALLALRGPRDSRDSVPAGGAAPRLGLARLLRERA